MKPLLIIISLLTLAASTIVNAADAAAGKDKAVLCVACHGADGNSPAPIWPNLAGQSADYLSKQIKDFRDGRRFNEQMAPMVAALTDKDAENIAAFFSAQKLKVGTANEEFVELGSKIYTGGTNGVMACTACHGPNGAGLEAAGFPQLSGQKAQYVINQLTGFKDGSRSNDKTDMMPSIAKAMNEQQIQAVANYITGLH